MRTGSGLNAKCRAERRDDGTYDVYCANQLIDNVPDRAAAVARMSMRTYHWHGHDKVEGKAAARRRRQLEAKQAKCDHKFIDSPHCLKCGWLPPKPKAFTITKVEEPEDGATGTRSGEGGGTGEAGEDVRGTA